MLRGGQQGVGLAEVVVGRRWGACHMLGALFRPGAVHPLRPQLPTAGRLRQCLERPGALAFQLCCKVGADPPRCPFCRFCCGAPANWAAGPGLAAASSRIIRALNVLNAICSRAEPLHVASTERARAATL